MKQLPQAMATGYIHIGTMTGKLNGVMPATTPSGWRTDEASTPVETSSENSPFRRWGMPQANSTTSMPRDDFAAGVLEDLAVLGGDQAGQVVPVPVGQLTEGEEDAGPGRQRRLPPSGPGGRRPRPRPGRRRPATPGPPPRSALPEAGSNTGAVRASPPRPRESDPLHGLSPAPRRPGTGCRRVRGRLLPWPNRPHPAMPAGGDGRCR